MFPMYGFQRDYFFLDVVKNTRMALLSASCDLETLLLTVNPTLTEQRSINEYALWMGKFVLILF
jgi:hypothetical protein